jgi:uncharacterized protein YdaU (DUF1376 family)
MNFYKHHIGDYAQATSHLSFVEDAAYSRLIRKYYAEEKPLPTEIKSAQRLIGARTKEEKQAVEDMLNEFFILEADGWHNKRCDEELARANAQADTNKRIAEEREARKKALKEAETNRSEFEHESLNESSAVREPSQTPDLKTSVLDTQSELPNTQPRDFTSGQIAAQLIKLGVKVTGQHPTLLQWCKDFTAQQIFDAVAIARNSKPEPDPIPANYLNTILRSRPPGKQSTGKQSVHDTRAATARQITGGNANDSTTYELPATEYTKTDG